MQKTKSKTKSVSPKVPYHKKPEKMSLDAWQQALRKQFAENSTFGIKKLDGHVVFSDYHVHNPATGNTYKVALRSPDNSLNFCTCLDFKTNGLGTCKHIEAVLHKVNKKARLVKILKQGYSPVYSSLYLQYGKERTVKLRIGTDNTAAYEQLASTYFDKNLALKEESINRLVAQELDVRKIKYENLNGSVPSEKRKALFDHFNHDPDSKVFLSTDAGGVGLNLQAASLLINLDIPWNPAILEQRIARIYRLGQKKNVNIINMVSTGTIEHKMLDVLKFKSSLAKGILDNGDDSIFMEDSKFKQFMKSVETMVNTEEGADKKEGMPVADQEDIQEEKPLGRSSKATDAPKGKATAKQLSFLGDDDVAAEDNSFADTKASRQSPSSNGTHSSPTEKAAPAATDLVSAGIDFFGKLADTLSDKEATEKLVASLVEKDSNTGKTYVKIPVENQKTVENALNLISGMMKAFQK